MPKVFIPQMPSRFDHSTNLWIPTVNIAPAKRFGELQIILPPGASRTSMQLCVRALEDALEDFGGEDVLVALGDPTLYAIAAAIVARKTGGLMRMLKWDRILGDYILVEVQI